MSQPASPTKKVDVCQHFLKGRCNRGSNCTWSHDAIPIELNSPEKTAQAVQELLAVKPIEEYSNSELKQFLRDNHQRTTGKKSVLIDRVKALAIVDPATGSGESMSNTATKQVEKEDSTMGSHGEDVKESSGQLASASPSSAEASQAPLQEQLLELKKQHEDLLESHKVLTNNHETLRANYGSLSTAHGQLQEHHGKLKEEHMAIGMLSIYRSVYLYLFTFL